MKHQAFSLQTFCAKQRFLCRRRAGVVDWGRGFSGEMHKGEESFGENLFVGCGGRLGKLKKLKNILIKKIQQHYHYRLSFK